MAVPHFLSMPFRSFERVAVTDVQTIIDDFEDQVLALPAPHTWTVLSAGVYQAPAYDNKTFRVTLTRSTQQKLTMELKDQNGITICTRSAQAPSTNAWTVRVFVGPAHMAIDIMGFSAAPEGLYAGVLDLTPDGSLAHNVYVYGSGSRTSGGTLDGSDASYSFMLDDTTASSRFRIAPYAAQNSGSAVGSRTLSGAYVYRARQFYAKSPGAGSLYDFMHYAGKAYQQLFCAKILAHGARILVPIDQGVLGEFIVCGGLGELTGWRVCVRSA